MRPNSEGNVERDLVSNLIQSSQIRALAEWRRVAKSDYCVPLSQVEIEQVRFCSLLTLRSTSHVAKWCLRLKIRSSDQVSIKNSRIAILQNIP